LVGLVILNTMSSSNDNIEKSTLCDRVNARISATLKGIRYGSVILTIHDSRIVQIERIEKSRFDDLYLENGDGI
jgi:hypothetical protein